MVYFKYFSVHLEIFSGRATLLHDGKSLPRVTKQALSMSFKKFSATHNAPVKDKPAGDGKSAPLVDQPPAPPSKAAAESKPAGKA